MHFPIALALLVHLPSAAKFAPAAGKTLLFVGQDLPSIADYERTCPVSPYGLSTYTSLGRLEGLDQLSDGDNGQMWAAKLAANHPRCAIELGLYIVGDLENINSGLRDPNIDKLAAFLIRIDRPTFVRIGYEFDGPFNGYAPTSYRAAFRRIVARMREDRVANVAFVWHSFGQPAAQPVEDWYPGDDVVDWFGMSYFYPNLPAQDDFANLAKIHGKPLFLCETSPFGIPLPQSWDRWFRPMLQFITSHDVAAICYINCHWDEVPIFASQKWGDARLSLDGRVAQRWRAAISQARFSPAKS